MIDKDSKLFGIINIIDLFIILVLIFAVIVVGEKFISKSEESVSTKKVEIKFFTEEVSEFVADVVNIGDPVEDEGRDISLGTITNIELNPGYVYATNDKGEIKKTLKEDYFSQEITAELDAQVIDGGIIIKGNKYSVGHPLTIRAGKGKIYLKISSIQLKGE